MENSSNPPLRAYTHLVAIMSAALITIWGLAALGSLDFWLTLGASAIFCALSALYMLMVKPAGKRSPMDDVSLREQARLAAGFDEALLIISKSERILFSNDAAQTLFGVTDDNTSLSDLIEEPSVLKLVRDTLDGHHPEPVTFHRKFPVEQHIRVAASGIFSEKSSGKILRAIIVFYDITDIVRVDTMRADFLANASHELKTPVASLLGYIETLQGHAKDDPEAQETFLGIMQQQAERMQRLINDLLSLRRIEIAEHLVPTETADLYLATRAAIEAVKPLARKKNIKIEYSGLKEALVIGSQDELVQLVLNILDNAMLVTPEDGKISLILDIQDEWQTVTRYSQDQDFKDAARREIVSPLEPSTSFAVLRISDKGPGFAPEHLPRIGERFYKIIGNAQPTRRGTGLGLAIVKHIMRRHRGGLFIQSTEGIGTVFSILLPLPPKK